jgi:cephalosporin hydroxylase
MNPLEQFKVEKESNINSISRDENLKEIGREFMLKSAPYKYTYNFTWLGCPIIQFPQDMVALQEIIWAVKPDLIIETGIAHGGSLILSASILQLIGGEGHVLGVDIDIREHNRDRIESHPMAKRISMIQGSSVDKTVIDQVHAFAKTKQNIMVILDSNHSHEHVMSELNAYSSLVSKNSYLIVFDTAVEDLPDDFDWGDRPWGKGNNPKTAVWEFLKTHKEFEIDASVHNKLVVTVAPDGYLKRVK